MSMHKIELTDLEKSGLTAHRLAIGKPSQLSDCFRLGVKWAIENTRTDGWVDLPSIPNESGRYTVNSSYGVRDAYFTIGFTHGDHSWQDCETNNDEGMENSSGEIFTVYSWISLPKPRVS